jgi:uncharacterized Zn-binding protein involved in type VI secretion
MTLPQARLTDMHVCSLTLGAPMPIIAPGAFTVLVQKLPAARITDICAGVTPVGVPAPHPLVKGSRTVMIQKLPASRISDSCAGGGAIVLGCFTVMTGG